MEQTGRVCRMNCAAFVSRIPGGKHSGILVFRRSFSSFSSLCSLFRCVSFNTGRHERKGERGNSYEELQCLPQRLLRTEATSPYR